MKRKPLVWPPGDPKLLGWPPHIHKIIDSLSSETSNATVPIYFIDPERKAEAGHAATCDWCKGSGQLGPPEDLYVCPKCEGEEP